jgi:hypothetical protein
MERLDHQCDSTALIHRRTHALFLLSATELHTIEIPSRLHQGNGVHVFKKAPDAMDHMSADHIRLGPNIIA